MPPEEVPPLFTIGHSTRSATEVIELLRGNEVTLLADIRTVPRSRKNPQFNLDDFPPLLEAAGISYLHLKQLGGLRRPHPDSPNTGWRNDSFRGFADYMLTPEFAEGLRLLLAEAARRPTAVMCAEAVPWRCHRSLIADAVVVRGIDVLHIMGPHLLRLHELHAFAAVSGTTVTYPPSG